MTDPNTTNPEGTSLAYLEPIPVPTLGSLSRDDLLQALADNPDADHFEIRYV